MVLFLNYLASKIRKTHSNFPLQVSDLVSGLYPDVLKMFEKTLNISVRQFKRIDGKWGGIDRKTGQWTGMVSNLITGDAELISTSLTLYGPRTEVIDFLSPISEAILAFAIKGLFNSTFPG